VEKLVMVAHTMVGEELHGEELQDLVKEATQPIPQKPKKKKTGKDEAGPSKAKAHERTLYPINQKKGVNELSMGSSTKTLVAPEKHKGKEKVFESIVESDEHIDFHSFELTGDMNTFIAPLDGPKNETGASKP